MSATQPARTPGIEPSVPVAIGVLAVYIVAFIGVTGSAGVPYTEWFTTPENVWRVAVLGLVAASAVLIAFLLWARWDFVWRDPEQLPMPAMLKVVVGLHIIGIALFFVATDWGEASDVILPIIVAGIAVGFAEEMMFRGIIVRGLRTNMRPEFRVAWMSALAFGLFHLTNLIVGSPPVAVALQVVNATLAGFVLYTVRRFRGALVFGMVVHGLWDIGAFLPAVEGSLLTQLTPLIGSLVPGIIALIVLRRDRDITVTSEGIVSLADEPASPSV